MIFIHNDTAELVVVTFGSIGTVAVFTANTLTVIDIVILYKHFTPLGYL